MRGALFFRVGCGGSAPKPARAAVAHSSASRHGSRGRPPAPFIDPHNIYAADRAGDLSPAVRRFPERVYVPDSASNTVHEIDPRTHRVVRQFAVGTLPQHVVPSYDLHTLWVTNDLGNSLTPIDPASGAPGRPV